MHDAAAAESLRAASNPQVGNKQEKGRYDASTHMRCKRLCRLGSSCPAGHTQRRWGSLRMLRQLARTPQEGSEGTAHSGAQSGMQQQQVRSTKQ
jgi:hypothetical protein